MIYHKIQPTNQPKQRTWLEIYWFHLEKVILFFGLNNFIDELCPWCNGYHRRKWTQRLEFKSWTRLIGSSNVVGNDCIKILLILRCPWCNGYRRRKWTQRHEFKSWTRLIAFHIALIPLGKVWIQLFSLQQWVKSRADWVLQPWWGN